MSKRPKQLSLEDRIAAYYLAKALLEEWEAQPDEVLIANHDYIKKLRAKKRQFEMYVTHRADPGAVV